MARAKEDKIGQKKSGMTGTVGTTTTQTTQKSLIVDTGCSTPKADERMTQKEDHTTVDHFVSDLDRDHEPNGAVANALILRSSNQLPVT